MSGRLHPGMVAAQRAANLADEEALRQEAKQHALSEAEGVARSAESLLTDPAFKRAAARLEAAYLEEWRGSQVSASGERERIFLRLRALDELKADLATAAAGGRLTARNLRLT